MLLQNFVIVWFDRSSVSADLASLNTSTICSLMNKKFLAESGHYWSGKIPSNPCVKEKLNDPLVQE